MTFFKKASGILGMNARNLEYISRYNSHANKKFADDKIFTKRFLESRNIGVAKLFHVIKKHNQLTKAFLAALPQEFVIKPNRGYAGGGILVIKSKKGKHWISISGKKITQEDLFFHCAEILDGKYSISGTRDQVIFEELLTPHADFAKLTESGLPDVRIIVFNKIPVIAMLRVPTPESDGKANMELGAYGLGIDIGTGRTTGGAYFSQHVKRLSNGESAVGFQIPYWEEILYAAAKIQAVTNIGYLGVDIVITKTGVKVLEINARSGLKIQIANRIPQKNRLKKIADLKVMTPEEGVEIAKTLFAQKSPQEEKFKKRPVIGAREVVVLNAEQPYHLVAKIDLSATTNKIRGKFLNEQNPLLDITLEGKRLKLPVEISEDIDADLVLAGRFLQDFYIDPHKKINTSPETLTAHVDEQKIQNIDNKIAEIDEQLKLLSYINPQNIVEQKALFFENRNYSPRFYYKELQLDIPLLQRELKKIPTVDHVLFPLFEKKIIELRDKITLLETVGTEDFGAFSEKVFDKVTAKDYQAALRFLQKNTPTDPDQSEIVNAKVAAEQIEDFLKNNRLKHWQVKFVENSVADMQVTKNGAVLIKKSADFSRNRLAALIIHEIGTHVFRNENGRHQEFKIFQRGTANYLYTEEGLAIHNQNHLGLDLGEKLLSPALSVVSIFMAQKMNFLDLFHYLKDTYHITDEMAWSRCIKTKRGFLDGTMKGAFTKDAVYFKGNQAVENFLKKGGNIADLYVGKVTIEDLEILKNYQDLKPARFLPY